MTRRLTGVIDRADRSAPDVAATGFVMAMFVACCVLAAAARGNVIHSSWIGGAGVWSDPANWSGGVVPANDRRSSFEVTIGTERVPDALVALIAPVTIDSIMLGARAELLINAGSMLGVATGSFNDHGRVQLLGALAQPATLRFDAIESTLDGVGEIEGMIVSPEALDSNNVIRGATPGVTLTHGADHVIRGRFELGADSLRLVNAGLIEGPASGTSTIDLSDGGAASVNAGVFRAVNGGTLQIRDSTIDNSAGVIEAAPGGTLRLRDAHVIGGGMRDTDGDGPGSLRALGMVTLDGVTVDGVLAVESYGITTLEAGTSLGGVHLTTATPAGYAIVELAEPQTTIGAGQTWSGTDSVGNEIRAAAGVDAELVIAKGGVIRGGMDLGAATLRLVNEGLIEADQPGGMLVRPIADTEQRNGGVMRAASGSSMAFYGGTYDNTGGVIEAAPGGIQRFGVGIAGGSFLGFTVTAVHGGLIRDADAAGPGKLKVEGWLYIADGVTIDGELTVAPPQPTSSSPSVLPMLWVGPAVALPASITLGEPAPNFSGQIYSELPELVIEHCSVRAQPTFPGSINYIRGPNSPPTRCIVASTATVTGPVHFNFRGGIDNHGQIECGPQEPLIFNGGQATLTNHPGGVIRLSGAVTGLQMWMMHVENHGLFDIGASRQINLSTADFVQMGGQATVHGTLRILSVTHGIHVHGGKFCGSGVVIGTLASVGGVIAPESANGNVATMTVTGTFVQDSGGTLEVDLGAAADAGGDADPDEDAVTDGWAGDRLAVNGAATLAGTLRVRLVEDYLPAPGESFTVLTAANISGEFETIDSCVPVEVGYSVRSVTVTFTRSSPADLNGDGAVDGNDLSILLGSWGPCAVECCVADIDGDGVVDGNDLAMLLGAWS